MVRALIDRDKVDNFTAIYGEPVRTKEHGPKLCLYYEEVPEGILTEKGGGWYLITLATKIQGKDEALLKASEMFNLLPTFELRGEEDESSGEES